MILAWILYLLAFVVSVIIILIIFYITSNEVVKLLTGGKDLNDTVGKWWNITLFFLAITFPFFGTYFLFNNIINYQPPLNESNINVETSVADNRISNLTLEIGNINKTLSNIDNLTINEIRSELNKTLIFIQKIKEETLNQQQIISTLRETAIKEKDKADKAIKYANTITSITNEQIEALKVLITTDAKETNQSSFWIGVLVSFPIGILASLIANLFLRRRKK